MKKTIAFFTGLMCIMSLTACGESDLSSLSEAPSANNNSSNDAESQNNEQETSSAESSDVSASETTDGKTLVVYFSASGNTAEVAEYIAAETGGDLFEIEPVNTYSANDLNWSDPESRVCYEHDDPDQRNVELVTTDVENWDSYDTVFIGYPIWWGIAAWPVDNFVKENDFSDKTVIPFCTSASSGIGESGELLAEMAGTGNWQNGKRFRSGSSEDDVKNWLNSLD